jgi:acetyltransferase-like isoleucine patch superfamily enzyme
MKSWWKSFKKCTNSLLVQALRPFVTQIIKGDYLVWGDPKRLRIHPSANVVNTLFNTSSGEIEVGEFSFMGHDVLILTGSHDYCSFLQNRQAAVPDFGNDINIGRGVWIGSRAVVLGPCSIGNHSVIAAGSVVTSGSNIPEFSIVAGCPGRVIKKINSSL